MTQTPRDRCCDLAIAYSKNRQAVRENAEAKRKLRDEVGVVIEVQQYRDRYVQGEHLNSRPTWKGWLHAVKTCHEWDGSPLDEDDGRIVMARLLDERKSLNSAAARIRNRFRTVGDQLRRAEP